MTSKLQHLGERFAKFAGVGAIGTAAHYATLFVLVDFLGVGAVAASSAGFVVGGVINYLLNYRFTFRSQQSHTSTAPRFFAIALGGFFLNGAGMSLFADHIGLHYLLAQVITTGIILVWTFLANHYWTFGRSAGRERSVETNNESRTRYRR